MRNSFYKCFLALFSASFLQLKIAAQDLPSLSELQRSGAQVSAFVVNLSTGKVLAQIQPDKRLSPASVSKLVIAADALDTWGADKTFTSQIFMRGNLTNGVLNGDLVFYGGGDPYLTNEKLWFLTTDVARFGIKKVTGKIIVNNSLFGRVIEDQNRNAKKFRSRNAYDSPLSSAAVNFSVLGIVVNPASQKGSRAVISVEPYNLPGVELENSVTTTGAGTQPHLSVERTSSDDTDRFKVSGNIPLQSPAVRVYRSVSNADQYAGQVINAFLEHAQVQTSGKVTVESTPLLSKDVLVSSSDSYPLSWQLKGLLEMSNNFIADTLSLDLLVQNQHNTRSDLKSAGTLLESYMKNATNGSRWGTQTESTPLVLESGSGLTPQNRLSAKDLVSLLDKMYFSGNQFASFLSAFPIPGETGTLKNRFSSSQQRRLKSFLVAKTGTLTEPQNVVSLAGYSRAQNGDWIAFATLINANRSQSSFGVEHLRQAIDSDLGKMMK